MSLKSILDDIGSDAKKVFAFLGSTKAQAIVTTGESVVESVFPEATGIITLANNWFNEIFKTQALATAAAQGTGSSTQKAAIALNAITPQVISFVKSVGLPVPDSTQLLAANNALVAFLNSFTTTPTSSTSTTGQNAIPNSSLNTAPITIPTVTTNATTGESVLTMGK